MIMANKPSTSEDNINITTILTLVPTVFQSYDIYYNNKWLTRQLPSGIF